MQSATTGPTGAEARKYQFPGVKQQEEARAREVAAKMLKAAEKKSLCQEDDKAKRALLEREKENFTKLYAQKCYNGWLKLYDNSAMILSIWLNGRLGRKYERRNDAGYGVSARYGIVSIPPMQVGNFVERLGKAGIVLARDDTNVLEFDLGERIGQEDMVAMLHEDELLIETANKIVMPKAVLTALRAEMKVLLCFVHVHVRDQRSSTKEIFLNDVERRVVALNKLIIAAARGRLGVKECLAKIGQGLEEVYEDATTMSDLGLITAKQYKDFVDLIRRVESEHAREIKRMAVAQAKKEIEKTKKQAQDE